MILSGQCLTVYSWKLKEDANDLVSPWHNFATRHRYCARVQELA